MRVFVSPLMHFQDTPGMDGVARRQRTPASGRGRGFDCAKPDLAVMKAAVDLGIVAPAPKNRSHGEADLKRAVAAIQAYGVSKGIRVPVIDLYFLIRGGQTGVKHLVRPEYYHESY